MEILYRIIGGWLILLIVCYVIAAFISWDLHPLDNPIASVLFRAYAIITLVFCIYGEQ